MEDYSNIIEICKNNEEEAIIKGAAMGAIILSRMGPIYEKGSVRKFPNLALRFCKELGSLSTIDDFDRFHERFVEYVQNGIKRKDGGQLSYGEAQKSVNVFLKTYVDRGSLPDAVTSKRIRPFLHVPLDSVMIKHFKKNFRLDYERYILPEHRKINEQLKVKIPDTVLSKLQYIFQEVYLAWQKWFRDIYPEKPVLLDTIWALEREKD